MNQDSKNAWKRFFLCALGLLPALSWAQSEPNGVKVGEGRLHPFFSSENRYDSAAGFFSANNTLQPEMIAHIMPGLRFLVPSSDLLLNMEAKLDYARYTGWLSAGSENASRLQAFADLTAAMNRNGSVEVDVADHFSRSDQTTNAALAVGALSLYNEARIWTPIHPGGRALEVSPGVAYGVEVFQTLSGIAIPGCSDVVCDPNQISAMNYQNIRPSIEANWKFLPKTAVIFDARLDVRSYSNGAVNPSSQLLKMSTGLSGLITPKVATVVKAGYSQDFHTGGVKTFIGQLELQYLLSETAGIKVGATRMTQPVPTFGAYGDNRAYIDGRVLLYGRLTLAASGAYDHLTFYGGASRTDNVFALNLSPEYQFANWLVGAIGYAVSVRNSSNANVLSVNFTRHEAYLRITLTY